MVQYNPKLQFQKYLQNCPNVIFYRVQLIGMLKDALQDDQRAVRVLLYAVEQGIIEKLIQQTPLEHKEEIRMLDVLQHEYSMKQDAARFSVKFWNDCITPEIVIAARYAEPWVTNPIEPEHGDVDDIFDPNADSLPVLKSNVQSTMTKLCRIRQNPIGPEIDIRWEKLPGLHVFGIWRSEDGNNFVKISETSRTHYSDKQVRAGSIYTYKISEKESNGKYIDFSECLQITGPAKPLLFGISAIEKTESGIKIEWPFQYGAVGYAVWRKLHTDHTWTQIVRINGARCQYVDTDVVKGNIYLYKLEWTNRNQITLVSSELAVVC